jgi:branched-chain amino acid transport system permease protein
VKNSYFIKNKLQTTTFIILALIPVFVDSYFVNNISFFMIWTFIALSLSLIWGKGGILSFGQAAFFGLAGYSFGIIGINFAGVYGVGIWSVIIALIITGIFGLIVGYFLFYGGIYDVFVGIVTLSMTLVFETFMSQTAGPEWTVGIARLNGFNGMQGMPSIGISLFGYNVEALDNIGYYVILILAILVLYFLDKLANSKFGLILSASKEDRLRVQSLGYNVKRVHMLTFAISAVIAGMSGILYTNWGGFITPESMGLVSAALPVVYCAASGKNNFFAVFLGTILLGWISQELAINGRQFALIFMGLLLVVATRYFPDGMFLFFINFIKKMAGKIIGK